MSDPQVDKLFAPNRDRPLIQWKWLSDMERSWENRKSPAGLENRCDGFRNDWLYCADGLSEYITFIRCENQH